ATARHDTDYWETELAGEVRAYDGPVKQQADSFLSSPVRVLDCGCEHGEGAAGLHVRSQHMVGVDLARRALGRARHRHADLPLLVGDVGRLPFPDACFEAVVSLGVIEHLESGPEGLLAEQARVLAPGGVLLLTVPARNWYRRWSDLTRLTLR